MCWHMTVKGKCSSLLEIVNLAVVLIEFVRLFVLTWPGHQIAQLLG